MATVQLEEICKRYNGASELAVDTVNLEVADGEFMVLLGLSGCGKSTTLRMIAGLLQPQFGIAFVVGESPFTVDGKLANDHDELARAIFDLVMAYIDGTDPGDDGTGAKGIIADSIALSATDTSFIDATVGTASVAIVCFVPS